MGLNRKTMKNRLLHLGAIGALTLLIFGCNNHDKAPPFPYEGTRYTQPLTETLIQPEPDTVSWTTGKLQGAATLPTKRFNWDQLPEKPFDIGSSVSLISPPQKEPFDLESLPSKPFAMDSLPTFTLDVKISVLGEPKIVKAGNLSSLPGTTRGVMGADNSFGLNEVTYSHYVDRDGIFWIGLTNGVASYDSETFRFYEIAQGLEAKYVNQITEDSKGRLWMTGNSGSLTMIDKKNNLVYNMKTSSEFNRYFTIAEDSHGLIWTLGPQGVQIIDLDKRSGFLLDKSHGLIGLPAFYMFEDTEGYIYLGTIEGMQILDPERKRAYEDPETEFSESIIDSEGRLWYTSFGGIYNINAERTEKTIIPSENFGIDSGTLFSYIYQDRDGAFWIGTENGWLFRYEEDTGRITKYNVQTNGKGQGNWIWCISQTPEGDIWFSGTPGFYKLDPDGPQPGNFGVADGLHSNQVWETLEAPDGRIWIGTYDGIDVYDPETKSLKHLGTEQGLLYERNSSLSLDAQGRIWSGGNLPGLSIIDPVKETIQQITPEAGLVGTGYSNSHKAPDGTTWLTHFTGEVVNVNLDKRSFRYLEFKDSVLAGLRKDRSLLSDPETLWVATRGDGVYRIDLTTNERLRYTTENGLISNDLFTMGIDSEKNIWIATDLGVQKIDEKNGTITTFTEAQGLLANDTYDIIEKDGRMYLGTSRGLTILDVENVGGKELWKVQNIGREQGLNYVDFAQNSMSFDSYGRFWAGVENQILTVMNPIGTDTSRVSSRVASINLFDSPLSFTQRNLPDSLALAADSLALGTTPSTGIDSTYQKTHNITWESTEGFYDLPVGLTLPSDQNYMSFNYNGGRYGESGGMIYRYILEGIDKNWSAITDQTTSENYRDLPPGNYTFKVASQGYNGIWSEPAAFSFTIAPPWWRTWWAYIGYLILLGLLGKRIHVFQKARTLRIERERTREIELAQAKEIEKAYNQLKETQQQLIQSEKMASLGELTAGIAHEIQNPLNFVNNFSEVSAELLEEMTGEMEKGDLKEAGAIARDLKQNLEKITHHGKRADSIVKGMLQHSRGTEDKKEQADINNLADEYLRLAYHGLRARNKSFNADMETELDPKAGHLNIVPQEIGRVILNLVTNAFYAVNEKKKRDKTDYHPKVLLKTMDTGNGVEIEVSDNGPGIPKKVLSKIFQPFFTTKPTGQGTGLGLSMSYDIITKGHGGDLKVVSQEGKGTTFTVFLPREKSKTYKTQKI